MIVYLGKNRSNKYIGYINSTFVMDLRHFYTNLHALVIRVFSYFLLLSNPKSWRTRSFPLNSCQ